MAAFEADRAGWHAEMFPGGHPNAPHHEEVDEWFWSLRRDRPPPAPLVAVLPRGGGKSTKAERGVAACGARRTRRYCVYVSETQEQADTRVSAVATIVQSKAFRHHYPRLGSRALSRYGSSRGWRRNRLWSAQGFVVDSLGLDTASRGLKADEQRPDLIVLDDLDGRHDSEEITRRKVETLTQSVLPIGADDCAVVALQNLIIPHGIFARLSAAPGTPGIEPADFLVDRRLIGPVPAIRGLKTAPEEQPDGRIRQVITAGEPTWAGQGLDACQRLIDKLGLRAFLREQQHDVHEVPGALWKRAMIRHVAQPPAGFIRVVVGVDPSGGAAEVGIVVAGLMADGRACVIEDATKPGRETERVTGPNGVPVERPAWSRAAWRAYESRGADAVAAEVNFGGQMVEDALKAANYGPMRVVHCSASRGKDIRAEPVVEKYGRGEVFHVGAHPELEHEMTTWVKGAKGQPSPNRLDALVWALTELFWPADSRPAVLTFGS